MLDAGKVDFMSYSKQTTHYGLPLPTASDRSVWTDNNTAFETIDSAIYTASQNATGASEAVTAMTTTVTGHTASISTLNAEVATLSTSVSGLESDLDTAEGKIDNLLTRTGALETKVSTMQKIGKVTGTFTGITIGAGERHAFEVALPSGVSGIIPLSARVSNMIVDLVVVTDFVYDNTFRVHMLNVGSALTNISPNVEITYAYDA